MYGATKKTCHPRRVAEVVLVHTTRGLTGVPELVLVTIEWSVDTKSDLGLVNINTPILCLCSARSVLVRGVVLS